MAFNVNELSSEIARNGIMKTNKFIVQFSMPLSMRNTTEYSNLADTNNHLHLYCESAVMPGAAVLLEEVRRYGYGVNEKKPFAPIFSDINLTFRGDAKGRVWNFLNTWMRTAVNFESRSGMRTSNGPLPGMYPYELGYKYDPDNSEGYAIGMAVNLFDDAGDLTMRMVMNEAYPIYIGDVSLSWASHSDYMRIPVTFTFMDWYNDLVETNNNANISAVNTSNPNQLQGDTTYAPPPATAVTSALSNFSTWMAALFP